MFAQGVFSNPAMNRAFMTGLVLQAAVLAVPALQLVFSVIPMTGAQWLAVLALAATPIPGCDIEKALRRTRKGNEAPQEREPAILR